MKTVTGGSASFGIICTSVPASAALVNTDGVCIHEASRATRDDDLDVLALCHIVAKPRASFCCELNVCLHIPYTLPPHAVSHTPTQIYTFGIRELTRRTWSFFFVAGVFGLAARAAGTLDEVEHIDFPY